MIERVRLGPLFSHSDHVESLSSTLASVDGPDASRPSVSDATGGGEITRLLQAARDGDDEAMERLYSLLYDELKGLAHVVRRGGAPETLNTTALVHEAYVRLVPSRDIDWQDRRHFLRVAARAMRQVLVRAAERRSAEKRGGDRDPVTLDEELAEPAVQDGAGALRPETVLSLNRALEELATIDPRKADVVECRFFAGLGVEETADALDVSTATVKRDWRTARAWLARALDAG